MLSSIQFLDNQYPFRYNIIIYKIKKLKYFADWIIGLKDLKAKISIARRIERMQNGNFGDFKNLGDKVYELKITTVAGYRVYYTKVGNEIIIIMNGGDKSTQSKDIKKAKQIVKEELS